MTTMIRMAKSPGLRPITEIVRELGLNEDEVYCYGPYKAKVDHRVIRRLGEGNSKLILVTAINPTPAGEGKTTTTIGLGDALRRLGKKSMVTLREPSLGPVFGVKGGATGGGLARVEPSDEINLHFTGDIHAVGSANNLLAAMLDNHIYHGNSLGIDTRRVVWRRCLDMNDRQLRFVVSGLGGKANGLPREDGFDITAASEVMAVLCLAKDLADLKERLARMVVAFTRDGRPVTAGDLKAQGAVTALLKDAFNPNLVQTLEGTPVFVHGGPFANIAHGCNSLVATRLALGLADYVVTEAGFGADLGAEKFIDIKCRVGGLKPDAVVIVTSVRALKHHGGAGRLELGNENMEALHKGLENLRKHVENVRDKFGLPVAVAVNRFPTDSQAELEAVLEGCRAMGVPGAVSEVYSRGGEGGIELARHVMHLCEASKNQFKFLYPLELGLKQKMEVIAREICGADGVQFRKEADNEISYIEELGYGNLPVCMAKTQYSLSDDPKIVGRPKGFKITVRSAKLCAGAGFVVAITGDIMTMPGLPREPAAEKVDVDGNGQITGIS
ncbi:MAG: formate--tetrahydrofolate ligase [Bacillota bacterium]